MADWQVGDLAVCIDDGPCKCGRCGGVQLPLSRGHIYRVIGIDPGLSAGDWTSILLKDMPNGDKYHRRSNGYGEMRFRKVRPDEHEACEAEFVTLIKRAKRPVSA